MLEVIVKEVEKQLRSTNFVEIEASGRHIHLSKADLEQLFGENYELTEAKKLSQPGQFACHERLTLVGPKGSLHNVIVLGPVRAQTQVEVSLTDARELGLSVPIRESGNISNSASITIVGPKGSIFLHEGLIIAKSHIHMTPDDAKILKLIHGEVVQVKVSGERAVIFDDVVIRVNNQYATRMHIDYDEANACNFKPSMQGEIIKKSD